MVATVVEHVVADAGAFLKRAPLQEIGKNIYTLKDVVDEIRDKPTKRSLAFLPYKLNFKEPFPEHVRFVTEFAKKTGDYPSLSATDIKVLALTYQLETENVGTEHLKKEPEKKVQILSTQRHPETPVGIAGFHFPSKSSGKQSTAVQIPPTTNEPQDPDTSQFNTFQFWRNPLPSIETDLLELLAADAITVTDKLESVDLSADSQLAESEDQDGTSGDQHEEEEESSDQEEDGGDGGGWITPSNIKQVQMDASNWGPTADVRVGCLTTDFAMQNVLIQIGLHVLSVNGMLIKNTRSYILRCHACFKTTTNMNKSFCPHCGNDTLKKVAVGINKDGTMQMHFSRNSKVLNPKGKRYSLPLPQGGKHANNPHLVDDQRFPQQRLSKKARQKTDVFDPDYLAGSSPFSEHDIYSRSASLQLRDAQTGGGRQRTNPNAARKKCVKK
ncbi:RNA-binding protein NOB1 [Sinocyclocheilus anshuiensis]|uniref:RNA-binding protein NOB1 n=1 Tax=Sinocyclocheilus anshuiensis TaxID=1608454 RepID=A0A671KN89_9TELE|nr:PREDICTED: RNA-binding protein NOB1 [Sinocyclocheilus anshuiensis]